MNSAKAVLGADSRDGHGMTPLSWAAYHGYEEMVRLLAARDDVKSDSQDYYGRTPLSLAAREGARGGGKTVSRPDRRRGRFKGW